MEYYPTLPTARAELLVAHLWFEWSVFLHQIQGNVTAIHWLLWKAVPIFLEQSHIWRKQCRQHSTVLCMRLPFPLQQPPILFNLHKKQLRSRNKCEPTQACKSVRPSKAAALSPPSSPAACSYTAPFEQATVPWDIQTMALIKLNFLMKA